MAKINQKLPSSDPEDNDCSHEHPVAAEVLQKYSVTPDPDAEKDIAEYVLTQARDERVLHVERVKTEYVLGDKHEIWDVTTDKSRWWVITNMTNLYSQEHFPSLDYTLSFHVGLMMRLRSRPQGPDNADPSPFDEVIRRREQADRRYESAIEPEEYQAVGMQLRECLLALIDVIRRRIELPDETVAPKGADFKAWADLFIGQLCGGQTNKELRAYLKTTAERTWSLVNWLTHHRDATDASCTIALHATDTIIGHMVQLTTRKLTGDVQTCPRCSSRNIRAYFDIEIPPDGAYFSSCGVCGWDDHPEQEEVAVPDLDWEPEGEDVET